MSKSIPANRYQTLFDYRDQILQNFAKATEIRRIELGIDADVDNQVCVATHVRTPTERVSLVHEQ
jgi:hypothetical protein